MTTKQSSIGRQLENLFCWWIPVGDRIPTNSRRLQHIADKLTDSLLESQALVTIALKTSNCKDRLEAIEGAIFCFEQAKTNLNALSEYCERSHAVHFISLKQKAVYLKYTESIGRQFGGWERKTKRDLSKELGAVSSQDE